MSPEPGRPEPMTELEREELISAYLDDELSADERARVEQWIADDSQARALFDELRALRASLQSLPRLDAPSGFAERVVQRVGQMTPTEPVRPAATDGVNDPQGWFGPAGRMWRPLAWASMATAVALLIAFMSNQREAQIARVPQPLDDSVVRRQAPILAPPVEPVPDVGAFRAGGENASLPTSAPALESAPMQADSDLSTFGFQVEERPQELLVVRGRAATPQAGLAFLRDVSADVRLQVVGSDMAAGERQPDANTLLVTGTKAQVQDLLDRLDVADSPVQVIDVSNSHSDLAFRKQGRASELQRDAETGRPMQSSASPRSLDESQSAKAAPEQLRALFIVESEPPK